MFVCVGLAKRVKARILLASTSEVYGDPEVSSVMHGLSTTSYIYSYLFVSNV